MTPCQQYQTSHVRSEVAPVRRGDRQTYDASFARRVTNFVCCEYIEDGVTTQWRAWAHRTIDLRSENKIATVGRRVQTWIRIRAVSNPHNQVTETLECVGRVL